MTLRHTEPHKQLNLSIPVALLNRLDVEARKQERAKTVLVRRALVEYLNKVEDLPKLGGEEDGWKTRIARPV